MVERIRKVFPEHNWDHDRVSDTKWHKYRVDLRLELCDRLICIECDEHQHISYPCDVPRMFNIWQDTGRPTIFIRWNPDRKGKSMTDKLKKLTDQVRKYLDAPTDQLRGLMTEYVWYTAPVAARAEEELSKLLASLSV